MSTTSRQLRSVVAVGCPNCEASVDALVPPGKAGATPTPRPYVGAFGEHRTVECTNGHTVYVYFRP